MNSTTPLYNNSTLSSSDEFNFYERIIINPFFYGSLIIFNNINFYNNFI